MTEPQNIIAIFGGSGALGYKLCELYNRHARICEVLDEDVYVGPGSWHVISLDKNPPPPHMQERFGENLTHIPLDVLKDKDIEEASRTVERDFGRLTHIVSLVGGVLPGKDGGFGEFNGLQDCPVDHIRDTFNYNLIQHVIIGRFFIPLLKKEPGSNKSITFMSSINVLRDYGTPVYTSAKSGLGGFAIAMLRELGSEGIRINLVLPGTVPNARTLQQPKDWETLKRGTALQRFATEDEVARMFYGLSHLHTGTDGAQITVDCGQSQVTPNFVTSKPAAPTPTKP